MSDLEQHTTTSIGDGVHAGTEAQQVSSGRDTSEMVASEDVNATADGEAASADEAQASEETSGAPAQDDHAIEALLGRVTSPRGLESTTEECHFWVRGIRSELFAAANLSRAREPDELYMRWRRRVPGKWMVPNQRSTSGQISSPTSRQWPSKPERSDAISALRCIQNSTESCSSSGIRARDSFSCGMA